MSKTVDKMTLVKRLEAIRYQKKPDAERDQLEKMNLAGSLLDLAKISHDSIYVLCRDIARHLLGEVPEPDDADLFEE